MIRLYSGGGSQEVQILDKAVPDEVYSRRFRQSIISECVAAFFWVWSYERNEMIGTREMGYIINPKPKERDAAAL